jgi:hypothetical protein
MALFSILGRNSDMLGLLLCRYCIENCIEFSCFLFENALKSILFSSLERWIKVILFLQLQPGRKVEERRAGNGGKFWLNCSRDLTIMLLNIVNIIRDICQYSTYTFKMFKFFQQNFERPLSIYDIVYSDRSQTFKYKMWLLKYKLAFKAHLGV